MKESKNEALEPPEVIHPLRYWDLKEGFGIRKAQPGDVVGIYFQLRDLNRTLKLHYWNKKKPFMFHIGMGQFIKGIEVGILGMKIGGIREMLVPPEYTFGKQGSFLNFPPHRIIYARIALIHLDRQGLPKGMKYTGVPRTNLTPYLDKEKGIPRLGVRFRRPEKTPESHFEVALRTYKLFHPLPGSFPLVKDRWWRYEQEWKRIERTPSYKRIKAISIDEFRKDILSRNNMRFKQFLARVLTDPQEEYSEIAQFELTLQPLEELLIMFIRRLGIIEQVPKGVLPNDIMKQLLIERKEAIKNFDLEQVKKKLDLVRTEETEDIINEILHELQEEMKPYEPPDRWI